MPTRNLTPRPDPFSRIGRHVIPDGGDAFVPDYRRGFVAFKDGDAEAFGEEFITAATSAESVGESARDEMGADELNAEPAPDDDD